MKLLSILLDVSSTPSTFGELAGYALLLFVVFIGFGILANGWPKFKK